MTNQQANYRGRARGHMAVWEEVRQERNILWISTCLTLGYGRAATLALLNEMVAQNAQAPGLRHPQSMGRGLPVPGTDDGPNSLAPIPRALPPLRFPKSWPQCLGKRCNSSQHISPY